MNDVQAGLKDELRQQVVEAGMGGSVGEAKRPSA